MQAHQETALVTLFDGNPVTNTLILAEGTGVQHKNVIGLVRKYVDDLSEFGLIAFQTRFNPQGKTTEFVNLNEPQATLIMTYMSNTPIIREFKKRLVAAFFQMAVGRSIAISTGSDKIQTKVSVNTSDLVREAHKGNKFAQRLLHHLTGMQIDDIAEEVEQQQSETRFQLAELIATYLDFMMDGWNSEYLLTHGIKPESDESDGGDLQSIVATPTNLFGCFNVLSGKLGLPAVATSVEGFGQTMAREASALEFFGYRRTLDKISTGRRFFRYARIAGGAA